MVAPPARRLAFITAARRVQVLLLTVVRQVVWAGSLVKSARPSLALLTVNVTPAGAALAPPGPAPHSPPANIRLAASSSPRPMRRKRSCIYLSPHVSAQVIAE